MKRVWRSEKGVMTLSVVEILFAVLIAAALLSWLVHPFRTIRVARGLASFEMQQRQSYESLSRVMEDIREASSSSMAWAELDPTKPGYKAKNFPWFMVQNSGLAETTSFICYYFDDKDDTLWRVET